MILHVSPGKTIEHEALEKEYDAIEARFGYPTKKRWQMLSGAEPIGTEIIEREWPNMGVMEATIMKAMADPEYQALGAKNSAIVRDYHWELLMPIG